MSHQYTLYHPSLVFFPVTPLDPSPPAGLPLGPGAVAFADSTSTEATAVGVGVGSGGVCGGGACGVCGGGGGV